MFKSHKKLTAAVLLSCACLMAPYYAHAEGGTIDHEESETDYPHNPYYWELNVDGKKIANFEMFDSSNDPAGSFDEEGVHQDHRYFFTNEKEAIATSMKYIVDMVGNPANTLNMNLKLYAPSNANASAMSPTWVQYDANGKPIQISDSELTATYLGKMPYNKDNGVAKITVEQANKWYTEKFPVLPSNGTDSDYYGTITHEMFHALGLGTYIDKDKETGDIVFGTKAEYKKTDGSNASMDVFTKYEMGIRDAFDRVVYYSGDAENGYITYDNNPINPNDANDWNRINGELKSRKIILITLADFEGTYADEANRKPDEFYVISDYTNTLTTSNPERNIAQLRLNNTNQTSEEIPTQVGTNGGAYFTGKNVNEVLTTYNSKTNKDELALIAWPDDSEVKAVPGLPLNGYESDPEQESSGDYIAIPELSHIELQNSLMSHQNYRNWCTYMEAEIALLQDLGYTIDRSKYFGKSIYNSGVKNEDNSIDYFTYTNNNGFNSDQTHGIGLHVYGSYVNVTQKADLNAAGDYGIGIRVDGVGNKFNIDSNISANGEGGNGLLVAYGKNHEITLNAGKTIEATGTDGVAARFDFGSNELSDEAEYRGSYFSVSYEKVTTPSGSGDNQDEEGKESGGGTSEIITDTPGNGDNSNTPSGDTNDSGSSSTSGGDTSEGGDSNTPGGNTNDSGNSSTPGGDTNDSGNSSTPGSGTSDGNQEEIPSPPIQNPDGAVARLQATIDSNEQKNQYHWVQNQIPAAINGELITNFNVAGTLKGEKAAIYISDNALVKNINILSGASLEGDIISKWNPNAIKYQNDPISPEDSPVERSTTQTTNTQGDNGDSNAGYPGGPSSDGTGILKPFLPSGEDGLTNLNFGVKYSEESKAYDAIDSNFNLSYSGDIKGKESLNMQILGGTLELTNDKSQEVEVNTIFIKSGATLKGGHNYVLGSNEPTAFTNNGTFDLGNGIQNISITGNYNQTSDGTLGVDFNSDADRDTLTISDGKGSVAGTIKLTPQVDYYFNEQTIKLDQIVNGRELEITAGKPDINNISPVLEFTVAGNDATMTINNQEFKCDYGKTQYIINVARKDNAYQSVADDKISAGIGSALDSDAKQNTEKVYVGADKLKLVQAIDFPLTTTNNPLERKKVMNANIKKLNPNVVGSQAQAVLETHTTLNNLVSVSSSLSAGSMSMNIPTAVRRGGLGPTQVEPPKYNSWRNIVIPFAAYTNQHNGSNGYTNHNNGVIGAMERTFANGLTHGYHAAINHQSTEDSGSTIKGEGLYLGTHASYAPEEWNGWSVFGSARLGVEQMRGHRRVYIPSAVPYIGTADGDWTGYSGSFNIGAALTKEHGVMRSGPFAALDYSFAHRPSVHEDGGAVRTNLESATYDSLRTQLGYRLVTNPKALHSYDSTQWQAHASVAWNHELLSDNGRTNYQLVEFPGATVEDDIETYGRDSMSIAAGVIFKTPNRLDVGLTLGSDIYRKGGSSIYGKVNFEWKF